jgi:limonene 1,2-monooxygenase
MHNGTTQAQGLANREQTMKSYELFARYVMPHFQGSAAPLIESSAWVRDNRRG